MTDKADFVLPVLPLKGTIVFRNTLVPVIIASKESMLAIEESVEKHNSKIVCLMIKPNFTGDYPSPSHLYKKGFACAISQITKMPDQKIRVLLRGLEKVHLSKINKNDSYLTCEGVVMPEVFENDQEASLLREKLITESENYLKLLKNIKPDIVKQLAGFNDPYEMLYFVCLNADLTPEQRQQILTLEGFAKKSKKLLKIINERIELYKLQKSIDSQVMGKISKMQKDHYLTEQLKTIHKELGLSADGQTEVLLFKEKLNELALSPEALKKTEEELRKLTRIPSHSPEYFVAYNYLTWVTELPWEKPEYKEVNIVHAENILNQDHYGLEKIKERILEYLAVMQFNKSAKAQILCFVGPPGVGKTSLGKSIAKALNKEFIRLSVGGVSDEAEIRGHRKTYIGAMPGIFIQSLKKTKTTNTLIMIDEIDKLGKDYKGDPSSALLEVLDPEQNNTFRDHYLDFGFDLSNVFFIATANNLATIPSALRDRMEVIKLSSYTEHEKTHICKEHLIPKKVKEFMNEKVIDIKISDDSIKTIIRNYTAEAGVRELERHINAIFRKSIKKHLMKKIKNSISIDETLIKEFLGVPLYSDKDFVREDTVGIAYGLAWTSIGGEVLPVEVTKYAGAGKFQMTGNIGKVMNESAKAAMSLIQHHHKKWGIKSDAFKKYDLHVHIPEGAVPKDGPSAGVTLVMAIVSVLGNRAFDHSFAMTGEISLTGKILPIGGLTEKIIAAQRYGFKNVIIPEANKKDWEDIKAEAKENLNFIFADHVDKVIDLVLKPASKRITEDVQLSD